MVVTREVSGWSVVPFPTDPGTLGLRIARTGAGLEIHRATGDAERAILRLAYLTAVLKVLVEPTVAAPDGAGFPARFSSPSIGAS